MNAPNCKTCHHWQANEPRPVPEVPGPRERRFACFRWVEELNFVSLDIAEVRRFDALRHNDSGICCRFPKWQQTGGDYLCGEYQA